MKPLLRFVCLLFISMLQRYAFGQGCSDYPPSSTPPVAMCAEVSANSWNWAVAPDDPSYCDMWYARTGKYITPIGSPFQASSPGKLADIFITKDYTPANGWELVYRDFGCSRIAATPLFMLVNKEKGIGRMFLYLQDLINPQDFIYMRWVTDGTHLVQEKRIDAYIEANNGKGAWVVSEFALTFLPAKEITPGAEGVDVKVHFRTKPIEPETTHEDVYPVPASEQLHIKTDFLEAGPVYLLNSLGQKVYEGSSGKGLEGQVLSVDVSGLPAGIYRLQWYTTQGVAARSIVIMH